MIDSVLTIFLDDKKKQLSCVQFTMSEDGLDCFAASVSKRPEFNLFRINTWSIWANPEPLDSETIKYRIDKWVDVARRESNLHIVATSVPISGRAGYPPLKIEQFGSETWPANWEEQGRAIWRDFQEHIAIRSADLQRELRHDPDFDLPRAFYAALWLAFRFKFFAISPAEKMRRELARSGAHAVGDYSDLRASSLKSWSQPYISGPPASPSGLARPQQHGGVSIFDPHYKGRKP
jgi:hypothetical protein